MQHEAQRSRRVFLALPISSPTAQEISEWRKAYRGLAVRWIEEKNLHVTLLPPWYERDVEEVIKELEQVPWGDVFPFEAAFYGVAFGPDPHRPRLIWAEGETPQRLLALKEALEHALGRTPEKRPFRLHLTLARFREEDFASFLMKKFNERVSWHERISSVTLMESHLSPGGADYEVLKAWGSESAL